MSNEICSHFLLLCFSGLPCCPSLLIVFLSLSFSLPLSLALHNSTVDTPSPVGRWSYPFSSYWPYSITSLLGSCLTVLRVTHTATLRPLASRNASLDISQTWIISTPLCIVIKATPHRRRRHRRLQMGSRLSFHSSETDCWRSVPMYRRRGNCIYGRPAVTSWHSRYGLDGCLTDCLISQVSATPISIDCLFLLTAQFFYKSGLLLDFRCLYIKITRHNKIVIFFTFR